MAKLKSKKSNKHRGRAKQQKAQMKFDKKIGTVFGILAAVVLLGALGYYFVQQNRIADVDISLEQLCEGGSTIYDASGDAYTTLDIKKAGGWVETSDIPDELRGVDALVGKNYEELIIEQFFPDASDGDILAKALEKKYSEAELEAFFLNTVYLGDGVYGLSSGAKHFFGCTYEELAESYMENFKDIIVWYLENGTFENTNTTVFDASMIYEENGYVDGVVKETAEKLMQTGLDELVAYNRIFFGDLSIYTYLDTEIQEVLDEAYGDKHTFTTVEQEYDYVQSAMVIMDHEGHIKAVASGNDGDKVLNRALSQKYQVGSTIKPVSTYALAIEKGLIHFSSLVENRQTMIKNSRGEEYLWPTNSDGEYDGEVIVTRALQESKNTVAVEIGRMVGEETMYSFMKDTMGFELVYYDNGESDVQLSALTLGYLYKGVSLAKMTSSYEIFSNYGQYCGFAMTKKVVSSKEEELVAEQTVGVQALSEETAYITNRLLYNNVNGEYGIAKAAQIEGVEVLGKTGTIGNDAGQSASRLFIGITGDYIAGVWIGYDSERSLSLQSYYNPDLIYSNIMSKLSHSGVSFTMPDGVMEHLYCEYTGMLATEQCQKTSIGYYTQENAPEYCAACGNNN